MRKLNSREIMLLKSLLNKSKIPYKIPANTEDLSVIDLDDGGMGSVHFKLFDDCTELTRKFGCAILEATLENHNGKKVFIELSVDEQGLLFELDSFTEDFKPITHPLNIDYYKIIEISSPPIMADNYY